MIQNILDNLRIEQLKQLYIVILKLGGNVDWVENDGEKYKVYVKHTPHTSQLSSFSDEIFMETVIITKIITLEPKIEDKNVRYSHTKGYIR